MTIPALDSYYLMNVLVSFLYICTAEGKVMINRLIILWLLMMVSLVTYAQEEIDSTSGNGSGEESAFAKRLKGEE